MYSQLEGYLSRGLESRPSAQQRPRAAGGCGRDKHIGGRERLADVAELECTLGCAQLGLAQPWFGVPTSALRRPRAAGGWYKSELTRGTRHLRGLASESPRGFPLEREAIGDLRSHLY